MKVWSDRRFALGLLAAGAIGLVASTTLLVERLRLAGDEAYVPTCSINPVLSCGSIMESWQASLLGFPNPIIGVAAFPVVLATGAALLAGASLARWYWVGLQVGVTAALALVGWLAFHSLYRIGALCPYCMVVWAVVGPLFYYVTMRNLVQGVFGAAVAGSGPARVVREWHAPVLLLAFVGLLTLISVRFWSYWSTLW
ncbi:putative membrane protein [Nocardioides salarius]|uniref:Membrane protein n=1 Tax=Nocardioides salarius TaxID=374513 RepID=A0ABS2MEB6_9ACTN|nr:vitamin K epoxide reductase family protein [Nocardioides salarius]MBM7509524.1 putative membrane protein [Nocardioides salarius]